MFVANDVAFQQAYPSGNRFVGGEFTGSLDSWAAGPGQLGIGEDDEATRRRFGA